MTLAFGAESSELAIAALTGSVQNGVENVITFVLSEQKMQITEYAAVFNSVEDKIDLYKLCCNLYLLVWPNFMKKIACRNYCRFGVLRDVTV